MKFFRKIVLLGVMIGILTTPISLLAQSKQEYPDLNGNWVGEYKVYLHHGHKMAVAEFRIAQQDGPHFRGINAWRHVDSGKPMTIKKGKLITEDEEPFIGVIGFDLKSITIVEHDDMGTITGQLVDRDTMQLIYGEPGSNAMVFQLELKRKP
ncbi:MAG: hypothetical protein GY799_19860 [Desulfobulbaceae bacterium]|nr:hypothetical protein [Desulfobulbaceae bacterium]